MCALRKNYSPIREVFPFTYPKLHEGKSWYVDFTCLDPATNTMRRKKYSVNSIKKIKERRKFASELIEATLAKLRSGWNPWVNTTESRGFTLLQDALQKYSGSLSKLAKYKTRKSYSSRLTILQEYIKTLPIPPMYVYQFDTAFVSDFLDWIYLDRECSARTRNNYRGWCSSLAAFFIERQYISSNPVEQVKTISETPKKRQPLTEQMLTALKNHLQQHDKMFLLVCQMEYYTFIRPEELSFVKIGDISIKEQSVFISKEVSKNKRDGKVALNGTIIKMMLDLDIFSHSNDCYLFGKDLKVCTTRASSEQFRRKWIKVRDALKWSDEYQFYSLKDSGIRDLANSQGIIIARDQARHTDVATTNKYLQGKGIPVHQETKSFKGSL